MLTGTYKNSVFKQRGHAGNLAQGVTVEHILDSIRENVGEKFERIPLTTRKDIRNIERAFGLQGHKWHDDDATSVMLWVEEMRQKGNYSPIILYKPQGQKTTPGPDNLHLRDFALAIQTPLQADLLKKFGNGKVICIDATHENQYNGGIFKFTLTIATYFTAARDEHGHKPCETKNIKNLVIYDSTGDTVYKCRGPTVTRKAFTFSEE